MSIEMRHAPFYGWISGFIGNRPDRFQSVWPVALFSGFHAAIPVHRYLADFDGDQHGGTDAPEPAARSYPGKDLSVDAGLFTFLLAGFPAGLVIYWTWNNTLSIAQQWWITLYSKAKSAGLIDDRIGIG